MTAIGHASSIITSDQSDITGAYVDTSASIASGNFTAGKKYLILCTALYSNEWPSDATSVRVLHGSTAFASSELKNQVTASDAPPERHSYFWWTVWTAVSGEGVKVQFKSDTTSYNSYIDQIVLVAINLSDDLTENTDWVFNDNSTSTTLGTSWSSSNNASITFTPSQTGDWLILTRSRLLQDTVNIQLESRLNRDDTDLTPLLSQEREESSGYLIFSLPRVFALTGSTQYTFTEQSRIDETGGGSEARTHSGIFALRLAAFQNAAWSYTDTDLDINTTTNFEHEIETQEITPTTASDVLIIFEGAYQADSVTIHMLQRLQVDETDSPATQTSDAYKRTILYDATDNAPVADAALPSLDASAHDIDIDASIEGTGTGRGYAWRSLVAFTMELAAAPPPPAADFIPLHTRRLHFTPSA